LTGRNDRARDGVSAERAALNRPAGKRASSPPPIASSPFYRSPRPMSTELRSRGLPEHEPAYPKFRTAPRRRVRAGAGSRAGHRSRLHDWSAVASRRL